MVKKPSGSLLYRYCDTKIENIITQEYISRGDIVLIAVYIPIKKVKIIGF